MLRLTNSNLLNSSLDRAYTLRAQKQEVDKMTNSDPMSLPVPAYAGGTKAITMTPIVGTPRRTYAEVFIPGEEALEDGELRVTVLGSGNPWVTRAGLGQHPRRSRQP